MLFRSAVKHDPEFAYAWLNIGNVAFSAQEFGEATRKAHTVMAGKSEGEKLLIEINMRFLDNDIDRQMELAKQLTDKFPESPRAWVVRAAVEAGLNKWADQRNSLKTALSLDPRFTAAHTTLGASYVFNEPKDFGAAVKAYKAAVAAEPGLAIHYWGLGDAYRAQSDLENARAMYTRAVQLDPYNGVALAKRGHVNSFLGNFDEARSDYDRARDVAVGPNKAFLNNYKMFTWIYEGKPDMAVANLEGLYNEIPGMGLPDNQQSGAKNFTLTNAAMVCMHKGMHDDAGRLLAMRDENLRASAKAVGTDEFMQIQEANIAVMHGMLAAREGNYRKAEKFAKAAEEAVASHENPRKNEGAHQVHGDVAMAKGDYGKAVDHYRQANLNSIYVKYHLALALEGAGETDEAKKMFREVADWNFNSVGYALVREEARKHAG